MIVLQFVSSFICAQMTQQVGALPLEVLTVIHGLSVCAPLLSAGFTTAWPKVSLSPVHTGDKVEFNTVDFLESQQSRPCRFDLVHIGNKVDRDKMLNSCCHRFLAKTGNKVKRIHRFCCRFIAGFGNSRLSTKSTVLNSTCRQCVPDLSCPQCPDDYRLLPLCCTSLRVGLMFVCVCV